MTFDGENCHVFLFWPKEQGQRGDLWNGLDQGGVSMSAKCVRYVSPFGGAGAATNHGAASKRAHKTPAQDVRVCVFLLGSTLPQHDSSRFAFRSTDRCIDWCRCHPVLLRKTLCHAHFLALPPPYAAARPAMLRYVSSITHLHPSPSLPPLYLASLVFLVRFCGVTRRPTC